MSMHQRPQRFQDRRPHQRAPRPTVPLKSVAEMTERGVIKFYDPAKGFGFVSRPGLPDAFLHASVVRKYSVHADELQRDTKVRFSVAGNTDQAGRKLEIDAIFVD